MTWGEMAGAVFGATLIAWVLLLLASAFARAPQPRPGPATLILGPEAPAIVDLLVHGWKPTRAVPVARLLAVRDHLQLLAHGWTPTPAAPVATLLDLAARGHLHLVADPAGRLVCQVPSPVPSEPLAPFEVQWCQQVAGRLSGDSTPAAALTPDPQDEDGKRWHAAFKSAVIDEARRLGLVRDRFSTPVRWGLRVAAALPVAALGWWLFSLSRGGQLRLLASSLDGMVARLPGWVAWGLFILACAVLSLAAWGLAILVGLVSTVPGGFRCTGAGCAAASHWLGVRAALLAAPLPHRLPEPGTSLNDHVLAWAVALGAAPDVVTALAPVHDGRVWSSAGGRWRQIRVSSRPKGLTWTRWPTGCRTFTGRVIRRWTRKEWVEAGTSSHTAIHYHVAVDDGRSDQALTWSVRKGQYKRLKFDSAVQVTIDHKGRLVKITKAEGTGAPDARPTCDEYVAWYSWAMASLANEAIVCHTAAAAATHVLSAGGDRDTAAVAAHEAAGDEAALRQTRADYGSHHSYIEWFIWARANLGLPDDRCHESARAAVQSIAAGGTQQAATEAARLATTRRHLPVVRRANLLPGLPVGSRSSDGRWWWDGHRWRTGRPR